MNSTQHIQITALLQRFRSWERGQPALDAYELAAHYGLDPFVVRRIGESEGVHFLDEEGVPSPIYDQEDTRPIRIAV